MALLKHVFGNRVVQSLLFWAVTFYAALELFSRTDEIRIIDFIYTFLFLFPFILIVSLHSFHLIPNYLEKSRFWVYGAMLIVLLATVYPAYNFSYLVLSEWLFPDYYLVGVYSPFEVLGFSIFFLLISSSLELSQNWFEGLRAKSRVSELETENVASELKALRAQVNPHFLFNSLNTIYNEARKKSDKAPQLILKLSNLLRYVVETMDQDKVLLEKELDYLATYIDLHKERMNDPEKVHFETEWDSSDQKIAPLLLIIFVENCFKHGDLTDKDGIISISLKLKGNELILRCKNTKPPNAVNRGESMGTGIQNARRRLELAYENRHTLDISQTGRMYETNLKIVLN